MGSTTLMSVEEYMNTSFEDGDREYIDGLIVEKNMGEIDHSDSETTFAVYLRAHYKTFWTAVEVRVQVKPTRFRVPDVILVLGPRPKGRVITEPPFLVIEVLSPEDRPGYMREKIADYLDFGVKYVWVVNPRTRRAFIHTAEGSHECQGGVLSTQNPIIKIPLKEILA